MMTDEVNPDHVITDPKTEFKINTYFSTVDAAIISIEERIHKTGRNLLKIIQILKEEIEINHDKNVAQAVDMNNLINIL